MEKMDRWLSIIVRVLTYILVAVLASAVTFFLCLREISDSTSKLEQLEALILDRFIGEADQTVMEDAAADAMIEALGDRWSYYIPASEMAAHEEQMNNAYVGIGVTVTATEDGTGFEVIKLEPDGAALDAGILIGDVIVEADGQSVAELGLENVAQMIRGEEGTQLSITVLRDGQRHTFNMTRQTIEVAVAVGQLLEEGIGLVTIANFDSRCASETKTEIQSLLDQGAKALIFDVRNNGGGYKHELVELLDYLLPDGVLFRSMDYTGAEEIDKSDSSCLEIPMAVLINGNSYSAAEFFAAALEEYDWAVTVGENTTGKGYFQQTYELSDGSAVGLSVGKYFTPNGVSLAEAGGLVPQYPVEVDEETAALVYAGLLDPEEDPQIQEAVRVLLEAAE